MKVIVPGGAGFLGSHFVERLLQENHEVEIWDNFHSGRRQNIEPLLQKGATLQTIDIRYPLPEVQADAIVNMACPASPPHYQQDPIYTWETSVLGTRNLLNLAKKNNMIFMQASTSEVYGDPKEHPQKESYWGHVNPVGIRSCYDEGKRAAETLAMDYHRACGVDVRIFRIFNTYGPNMHPDDGRVVSNFCVQALRGKPLTIYGDGSQTRSFCYVTDLIEGIYLFLMSKSSVIQENRVINLGNPGEFTIKQLGETIFELLGKKEANWEHLPLPSDDPARRRPDISLAKKILNWEPRISLKEGLKPTLDYFRKEIFG
ncbi:MAG: SDR family oxidoreductase [Candidatus Hydrogenedentota bacterium]|nr:MAG: SDR family oxidoreductase [Candidatus Hydrogenedentota bacterium]